MVGLAIGIRPSFLGAAPIAGNIKLDHFGYRTTDPKIAYFTANPVASVEVHDAGTNALVYTTSAITDKGTDTGTPLISGDHVWWVDFSTFTTAGSYYLLSTTLNEQSYNFQINDGIYQIATTATLKALYYQRCGTPKPAAYAGANWADAASCHTSDATCGPAPGCTFPMVYGTLNLSGGWHDAGDYNKYIGQTPAGACNNWGGDSGEALWDLLTAYEWNPALFAGLQTNIPESGNGNPDILNEAKWELDWYLKMQMTDHHVLSVVHQTAYTTGSPPSTDPTTRYYYPPNPAGEAQFVALLSHAARVMSAVPGLASYAATLRTAAENTWNSFVSTAAASDQRFWAAAEIFRMEQTMAGPASIITAAQTVVDNYKTWSTPYYLNENAFTLNWGILTYMQASGATVSVVNYMKTSWGVLINDIFNQNDLYNSGMHSYDYFWGADEVKANYSMDLVWASKLAATGTHSSVLCLQHAEDFLHYMNGSNPVNMTLMTNAAALGASHGIWRIYHSWFGSYGVAFSFNNFIGKPASVVDPLYPYFAGTDQFGISDSGSSTYGPPPGIVPDGPSHGYAAGGGLSQPPMLAGNLEPPYEKEYRDWNWVDPGGNQSVPWIVNETGLYYTGSYMAMASAFVTSVAPTPTPTNSPTNTLSPTGTRTATLTPTNTPTNSPTVTPTNSPTLTPTVTVTKTPTPTAINSPTNSPTPTASSTATNSPTRTSTNSSTPTPTLTSTLTPTVTATNSPTKTPTLSPTNSPTLTPTSTATNSPTPSPSKTPTFTPTNTPSSTPTLTATNTPTRTPSNTATVTITPTPSNTATLSPTGTLIPTSTFTNSPTDTPTDTATKTPTNTPSSTPTQTPTNSFTSTPTNTPTKTPTNTPTLTPTNSPTLTATPTVTSTPTNTPLVTNTATNSPTNSSTRTPTSTPTPAASLTPTNSSTNTPLITNTATSTPTNSTTSIASLTATLTASPTATKTPTFTVSLTTTNTPAVTNTSTNTTTATALTEAGSPSGKPVIFPNPSDGTQPVNIQLPGLTTNSNVNVRIFTTAFRKVQEISFTNVPAGIVSFALTDRWGTPLASGLYYVVITTGQGRWINKLLILR